MRITISLSGEEHDKLQNIARSEHRSVREQAAHVVTRWLDDAALAGEEASGEDHIPPAENLTDARVTEG